MVKIAERTVPAPRTETESDPGAPADRTAARPSRCSDKFDNAIADFAETYADQNERDYGELSDAVRSGRAEAQAGP